MFRDPAKLKDPIKDKIRKSRKEGNYTPGDFILFSLESHTRLLVPPQIREEIQQKLSKAEEYISYLDRALSTSSTNIHYNLIQKTLTQLFNESDQYADLRNSIDKITTQIYKDVLLEDTLIAINKYFDPTLELNLLLQDFFLDNDSHEKVLLAKIEELISSQDPGKRLPSLIEGLAPLLGASENVFYKSSHYSLKEAKLYPGDKTTLRKALDKYTFSDDEKDSLAEKLYAQNQLARILRKMSKAGLKEYENKISTVLVHNFDWQASSKILTLKDMKDLSKLCINYGKTLARGEAKEAAHRKILFFFNPILIPLNTLAERAEKLFGTSEILQLVLKLKARAIAILLREVKPLDPKNQEGKIQVLHDLMQLFINHQAILQKISPESKLLSFNTRLDLSESVLIEKLKPDLPSGVRDKEVQELAKDVHMLYKKIDKDLPSFFPSTLTASQRLFSQARAILSAKAPPLDKDESKKITPPSPKSS